jgi:ankyrin repeat protein
MVELLLNHPEVEVNMGSHDGLSPLFVAASLGHEVVVRQLLAQPGIEVNKKMAYDGSTALNKAADIGNSYIVQCLLAHPGIEVNNTLHGHLSQHETPILHAAEMGHELVVALLLRHPDIVVDRPRSIDGLTAIDLARQQGHTRVVKLLEDYAKARVGEATAAKKARKADRCQVKAKAGEATTATKRKSDAKGAPPSKRK